MPQFLNQEIPESLRNFDSLPDSAHVRQPVVQALFAISSATVWRRVKNGSLPRPYKHGPRTTTWNVGELRGALAAKSA
jgi:predicted DNA-binding transcriptional regulator AlpA